MKPNSIMMLIAALTASALVWAPALQAQTAAQPLAKEAVLTSLTNKLDTKKAKVGDPVTAKTLKPLSLSSGTIVPSGSKILGKVTQVQPKSSGTAMLAITFDQLEKKGSAPMQVHGLIVGVAPVPDLASGGSAANDVPAQGGSAGQNAAMSGAGASMERTFLEGPMLAGSSIKGVTLSTTPAADGSVALQSTEKDIKLDSGTRLEIGLSAPQ